MRYIINTLKMLGWLIVIAPANGALMAHEFWIDPLIFELPADAPLVADIRVDRISAARPMHIIHHSSDALIWSHLKAHNRCLGDLATGPR